MNRWRSSASGIGLKPSGEKASQSIHNRRRNLVNEKLRTRNILISKYSSETKTTGCGYTDGKQLTKGPPPCDGNLTIRINRNVRIQGRGRKHIKQSHRSVVSRPSDWRRTISIPVWLASLKASRIEVPMPPT